MAPAAVYYLVPDYSLPSWGMGLLYHHVRLLRRNGIAAWVLHAKAPFRITWLEAAVPVQHLDAPGFAPSADDVLVVPEVLARVGTELSLPCRRLVFVQGPFLGLSPFDEAIDYRALGYQGAITTMPHSQIIVERHFGMRPALVPPFVASYFFVTPDELRSGRRARRVLLLPKEGYRAAGLPDYDIARKLIARRCRSAGGDAVDVDGPGWEVLEVANISHREVAEIMHSAAFLVSVNSHESFNATVPEAMAAGCIALCYDAFGGRDYLVDRGNAFVVPNQHVYALVETLFDLMDHYPARAAELARIRAAAYLTAQQYREQATEAALLEVFRPLLA